MSSPSGRTRPLFLGAALLVPCLAGGAVRLAQDTCGPFSDVPALYCPYVLEAYYTGITAGTSPTTFSPDLPITRAQASVFTTKALNQSLSRGSRRAALGQWWTPQSSHAFGLTAISTPTFVASDGTDVWVASEPNGTVTRVHGSDARIIDTWTGITNVNALLPAMGKILVTAATNLYVIDPSQPPAALSPVATGLGLIAGGLAFDGSNVWTSNGDSVSIISPGSTTPWGVQNVTQGFSLVGGIVFDGTNVWVCDSGAGALLRLDPNGAILQTVALPGPPTAILFDGINLWVALSSINQVGIVRASTGTVLTMLSGNGLNYPSALAFDGERVMVANFYGTLSLYRAADLQPMGSISTVPSGDPISVCSDGLNFWITMSITEQLARF